MTSLVIAAIYNHSRPPWLPLLPSAFAWIFPGNVYFYGGLKLSVMKKGVLLFFILGFFFFRGYSQETRLPEEEIFHSVSSHDLLDYAAELSSAPYEGRLSGSPGYEKAARWVALQLESWGIRPLLPDSSYFQWFSNPWTEVLDPGSVILLPSKGVARTTRRVLEFPEEFFPGSNSASGKVTGEVVYAGFGISAPELEYDDYAGLDVRDKIVMLESGVPYSKNDSLLKSWEKYSYHRYKFARARELGAAGLLYTGLVANPNTSYLDGFVYAHVGEAVAGELMKESGHTYASLKKEISQTLKPNSFETGRKVTIKAKTRHFGENRSCNVIGMIEGSDPLLKEEALIVGAHLDAVGHPGMLFPGALDNASGCADLLGAAKALASSGVKPARTIIFVFFGGEECGLYGSRASVENPWWPREKVLFMLNLDMVGNGKGFFLQGGLSYPAYLEHFQQVNNEFIHRNLRSSENRISYGRPRTDSAVFQTAGYPTMNLWTTESVKTVYYHHPLDNTAGLTPEIMEDAAKLIALSLFRIANDILL